MRDQGIESRSSRTLGSRLILWDQRINTYHQTSTIDPLILWDHEHLKKLPPKGGIDTIALIPDPYLCEVLSRDQCGMVSGVVPPHTSHLGPPASRTQARVRTLIRAASTKAENKNEEGKTKMGFQNWATPPAFIEWCEKEVLPTYGFSGFGLDACAEPHNCKALRFLAPVGCNLSSSLGLVGIDGLNASWANYGAVWCNPGFAECAKWLDKAAASADKGVTSLVLTHACHGAKWFRKRKEQASAIWLINPRINFLPPEGVEPSSNNRDSYLWVFSGRCRPVHKFIYPNAWRN